MSVGSIILAGPSANCGKTELACRLVAALPGAQALKLTRFHRESHCPVHGINEQGEDNCDGCAPAPAGFELIDDPAILNMPGKDSDRLQRAGAKPVLWLRAAPHVFRYALSAATKRYDSAKPLILEGNSAATVEDFPGFVVVLWPQKSRGVKDSVLPALRRADMLVLVEAESEPHRAWPRSLEATLHRHGIPPTALPEPLWLPANWWQGDQASSTEVCKRILDEAAAARSRVSA
jgi:hypothetical protein